MENFIDEQIDKLIGDNILFKMQTIFMQSNIINKTLNKQYSSISWWPNEKCIVLVYNVKPEIKCKNNNIILTFTKNEAVYKLYWPLNKALIITSYEEFITDEMINESA